MSPRSLPPILALLAMFTNADKLLANRIVELIPLPNLSILSHVQ